MIPFTLFIQITKEMINRYKQLRKIFNVDIEMLGNEVFNQDECTSYIKEKQQQKKNKKSKRKNICGKIVIIIFLKL